MLRIFSRLVTGVVFLLAGARAVGAESAPTAGSAADPTAQPLPPELQAELDALQRSARSWQPSANARASLGWRDNILLSPFAPIERGFARGEVEALLLRPMQHHWEFISFLNGDVLRYFSPPPETGGEQQWSLHAEARWQPVERARFSLKGAGYLRDMVIDLSQSEATRDIAPTRVRGGYVVAATRLTLPAGFHLEPFAQVKRTDYREYAGDHDEFRAGGRLEWRRPSRLALSAGWFQGVRNYDERTNMRDGVAVDGLLRFHQREGDVKARTTWKAGGDWSLAATVGRLENRDRASGFFDYNQKRARLEVGWQGAAWRANVDAEAKRMDYLHQTVGAGIAPPARITDDFETTLRLEREMSERWTVFGEHRWERSRANEIDFNYRANTVLAGLQRSF